MYYDVKIAKYLEEYKIHLEFEDGISGVVDLSIFIGKGEMSKSLTNIEYFKTFSVNEDLGTICWDNGYDIAPETLYFLLTGRHNYKSGLPDYISGVVTKQ